MMNLKANNKYLKIETMGGLVLLLAAIFGFSLSNSSFSYYYESFINFPTGINLGTYHIQKPLIFWINDGLVSIFFLLIGLEIKSMIYTQEFSLRSHIALPSAAAIAGAIVPALIYSAFNYADTINMRGWAIPTAMDTAFILGVLALLRDKISSELKMFVMTLSIIDDILAVLVIAIFYADNLSNLAIIFAASILGILTLLNQAKVTKLPIYLILGFLLWATVLGSGVHTSIAGVLLAATIPISAVNYLKNKLHAWVAYLILPIFAFANTDVPMHEMSLMQLTEPLALGIIFGLFIGKPLGIFGIIYMLVKHSSHRLPKGTSWDQMFGVSVLCGIGFTMSLFIGVLAFESGGPAYDHLVKASVFVGSILAAIFGFAIMKLR